MKFCLYTICVSPHQLPLAQEMVKLLGEDEYRYVYVHGLDEERARMGWETENPHWMVPASENRELLETCDVLMSGERDVELFRKRSKFGLRTIYCSERWFKPLRFGLTGRFRMLVPSYRRMAKAIVGLVTNDPNFSLLPIGVHAAEDFAWLLGCKIEKVEKKPFGRILGSGCLLDKMHIWGYFVAKASRDLGVKVTSPVHRILWVGRFLNWKRVEDVIRAALRVQMPFDVYGSGPNEARLMALSRKEDKSGLITIRGSVPIGKVRDLMANHDIYVLSSNAYEGWGAVVNEALEEGMQVYGTYEAGSSSTILPESHLYHAGKVDELVRLLEGDAIRIEIGDWSVQRAAEILVKQIL